MREYKRFTKYSEENQDYITPYCDTANCNGVCVDCDYEQVIINRLAELEDKIEQGKMLELICKVGDKVYVIDRNNNLIEMEIISYMATNKYVAYSAKHIEEEYIYSLYDSELNYDWFLTKAEAEQKLKELKEEV